MSQNLLDGQTFLCGLAGPMPSSHIFGFLLHKPRAESFVFECASCPLPPHEVCPGAVWVPCPWHAPSHIQLRPSPLLPKPHCTWDRATAQGVGLPTGSPPHLPPPTCSVGLALSSFPEHPLYGPCRAPRAHPSGQRCGSCNGPGLCPADQAVCVARMPSGRTEPQKRRWPSWKKAEGHVTQVESCNT